MLWDISHDKVEFLKTDFETIEVTTGMNINSQLKLTYKEFTWKGSNKFRKSVINAKGNEVLMQECAFENINIDPLASEVLL